MGLFRIELRGPMSVNGGGQPWIGREMSSWASCTAGCLRFEAEKRGSCRVRGRGSRRSSGVRRRCFSDGGQHRGVRSGRGGCCVGRNSQPVVGDEALDIGVVPPPPPPTRFSSCGDVPVERSSQPQRGRAGVFRVVAGKDRCAGGKQGERLCE